MENILEIKDLHTYFYTKDAIIKAVEGVNLYVKRGEVLGLIGESACGKTTIAYSLMKLITSGGKIINGEILFEGRDLVKLSDKEMRKLRGSKISIIFQEPTAALNPLYTVGFQMVEMIKAHHKNISKQKLLGKIYELWEKVGLSHAEIRIKDYPHNLSGGQVQRVLIAMAISCNPLLLIADEPTSSLDVTIQAQIIDLFRQLTKEVKFSLIFITHNLALCSQLANRIAIMYAGKIVELANVEEIFNNPLHPYTKALFAVLTRSEGSTRLEVIEGLVPNPSSKPSGCHFHPRCPFKLEICRNKYPEFKEIKPGHTVSCFNVDKAL